MLLHAGLGVTRGFKCVQVLAVPTNWPDLNERLFPLNRLKLTALHA